MENDFNELTGKSQLYNNSIWRTMNLVTNVRQTLVSLLLQINESFMMVKVSNK